MAQGDFVLYRGDTKSMFDEAIMKFSNGPFCHVELDMGDGTYLGEHGNGLTRHPADVGRLKDKTAILVTPAGNISAGMTWANTQWEHAVTNHQTYAYSWEDIVMDAAKFVGLHIVLKQPVTQWDCSDFVTRYLVQAMAASPLGKLAEDPSTVSPNDLGRAFKVK